MFNIFSGNWPIPTKDIKHIQSLCAEKDDDLRWLVALLSDTGMRLGEGVGLLKSDMKLDCEIPHIKLIPHPWMRNELNMRYLTIKFHV